jgi:Zn-finger nucleic acid-binding protein
MPEILLDLNAVVREEINIDVYCGTCGAGLCQVTTVDNRRRSFSVDACPDCMARKDEKIKELEEEIDRINKEAGDDENGITR